MMPQSKPTRNADLRHRQSIGRQRQSLATSPAVRAEAIACVIRKRLADGQPLPDLNRWNLSNETWCELLALLDGLEVVAVRFAAEA